MSDEKSTAYAMIPMEEYERLKEVAGNRDEDWITIKNHYSLVCQKSNEQLRELLELRPAAQRWKAVADFFELRENEAFDIDAALKQLQSDARKWEIVAKKTLETPGYIHNERHTQTVHMAQETYDDLISCWHEKNLSLKADAEKWRAHIGTSADNPDGTVSLSGIGDQEKKDMELGRLVRKMPKGASLRVLSDGWATTDANHVLSYNKNTPEEALKAILKAAGIE